MFLMTCFRTPFHEETEFLSVLRFLFRVRTPERPRTRVRFNPSDRTAMLARKPKVLTERTGELLPLVLK